MARSKKAVQQKRKSAAKKVKTPAKVMKANKDGKRQKKRVYSLKRPILAVLKQVHPNSSISKQAMEIMHNFIMDMFERLATEAAKLTKRFSKTLSSRCVQTAVRLNIPGELAKHAMSEATKAVVKFKASTSK